MHANLSFLKTSIWKKCLTSPIQWGECRYRVKRGEIHEIRNVHAKYIHTGKGEKGQHKKAEERRVNSKEKISKEEKRKNPEKNNPKDLSLRQPKKMNGLQDPQVSWSEEKARLQHDYFPFPLFVDSTSNSSTTKRHFSQCRHAHHSSSTKEKSPIPGPREADNR